MFLVITNVINFFLRIIHITPIKPSNQCNIWLIFRTRGRLFRLMVVLDRRVSPSILVAKSFTPAFLAVESSNDSVLRVMWICFNADQFHAIVHDSDHTRSLRLAPKLFPVCRHVDRGNNNLGEALEVLDGVKADSDGIADFEWFDDAVEELRKELVKRQLGDLRGRGPWEQRLSTRPRSRGTCRGGGEARIWRGGCHRRSPQGWWTRVRKNDLRYASENIIVTKLPLPRHHLWHIRSVKCMSWCRGC